MINWFNAVIFDVKSKNSTITSTLVFWHRLCYRIVQEWFAMRRSTPLSNILCAPSPHVYFSAMEVQPYRGKIKLSPPCPSGSHQLLPPDHPYRLHIAASCRCVLPRAFVRRHRPYCHQGSLVLKGLIGCSLANHKNTTKIYPCNNPWWQYLWPVPSV
jgi:hypothetical protein